MISERTIVYIDGYNFYRALKKHSGLPIWLGWCDFSKLSRKFLLGPNQHLIAIKYFTARVERLGDRGGELGGEEGRQLRWLAAAETIPELQVIEGSFRGDEKAARPSQARKEKQTDINIAVNMVSDALLDRCDVGVLISADHDFVPALQAVHQGGRRAELWLPPGHQVGTLAVLQAGGIKVRKITEPMLQESRLPNRIEIDGRVIEAPKIWQKK